MGNLLTELIPMKTLLLTLCLLSGVPAMAAEQPQALDATTPSVSVVEKAINKVCPISKDALDGETFITYEGHTIGFCCGGCDSKFLAWSQADRDAFVKASLAASQDTETDKAAEKPEVMAVEPYTLTTCPVSGEALGSMGDPIVVEHEGREVKLCCKGCVKKFNADPAKFVAAVDKVMIDQQRPYYMLSTCIVSGESLIEEGQDVGVEVLVNNRLFRVCCKSCVKKVKADPLRYRKVLDKHIAEVQRPLYPLTTCIVKGEKGKLGAMGEPVEFVVGNRLVRLCCSNCESKFQADPVKFIAQLDAAWAPVLAKRAADAKKAHGEHKQAADHDDNK